MAIETISTLGWIVKVTHSSQRNLKYTHKTPNALHNTVLLCKNWSCWERSKNADTKM